MSSSLWRSSFWPRWRTWTASSGCSTPSRPMMAISSSSCSDPSRYAPFKGSKEHSCQPYSNQQNLAIKNSIAKVFNNNYHGITDATKTTTTTTATNENSHHARSNKNYLHPQKLSPTTTITNENRHHLQQNSPPPTHSAFNEYSHSHHQ